jgi:hypothetical protein
MSLGLRLTLLAGLAAASAGVAAGLQRAEGYDLKGKPAWQVALPDELAEISGLAFSGDGRLYAHGDELGIVYQIDPKTGRILATVPLGRTGREPDLGKKAKRGAGAAASLVGDFEGLAIAGSRFFLVTSTGVLLEFEGAAARKPVPATIHTTGLGSSCEVEGLEHDPAGGNLLLLCKDRPRKGRVSAVQIHAWSLKQQRLASEPVIVVPYAEVARVTRLREFNGSGLSIRPGGKSILLVAGPQRAFMEIDLNGKALNGGVFPAAVQRQPEGVAFAPDGSVLVSSEAAGRRATLAGYLPLRR